MIDSASVANSIAHVTGIVKAVTTGLGPLLSELATFVTVILLGYHTIASKLRHDKTMQAVKPTGDSNLDMSTTPEQQRADSVKHA